MSIAVALLGVAGGLFYELGGTSRKAPRAEHGLVATPPVTNVVSVRWRDSDVVPAAAAGEICLDDAAHGRICAHFVAGERPADTLTRELTRRGLVVQSSG